MSEKINDDDCDGEGDEEDRGPEVQPRSVSPEWMGVDRPWSFDGIVGQTHVKEALRKRAKEQRCGDHIILHGPPGVGKHAIALLYGQAIQCTSIQPDGSPCRKCTACLDFANAGLQGQVFDLIELQKDEGQRGKPLGFLLEQFRDISGGVFSFPRVPVFVYDRIDDVEKATADLLLATLESFATSACCIFIASDISRVRPAVRSRCSAYMITRLTRDESLSRLKAISLRLSLPVDFLALDIIATQSGFRAGSLIHRLWEVSCQGAVTIENARIAFGLKWSDDVVAIWKAILGGNCDLIQAEFKNWLDEPVKIINRLRCCAAAVELYQKSCEFLPSAFLHQPSGALDLLVGCMRTKAEEIGVSNETLRRSVLSFLSRCETGPPAVELAEVFALSQLLQKAGLLH